MPDGFFLMHTWVKLCTGSQFSCKYELLLCRLRVTNPCIPLQLLQYLLEPLAKHGAAARTLLVANPHEERRRDPAPHCRAGCGTPRPGRRDRDADLGRASRPAAIAAPEETQTATERLHHAAEDAAGARCTGVKRPPSPDYFDRSRFHACRPGRRHCRSR